MDNSLLLFYSGALGTSVFDSDAVLLGASGGVYALVTAHLPSVLLVSVKPSSGNNPSLTNCSASQSNLK